jgi:hypothetical protein
MRRAFDWLFRHPTTGRLAIVQWPNPPLWLFLAASVVRRLFSPHGAAGTAVSVLAGIGLVWWAADEVWRGDSRFRRALGAVVLAAFVGARLA